MHDGCMLGYACKLQGPTVHGEQWSARPTFSGGFDAKHKGSPGCAAGNKVVRILLPASMRETEQRLALSLVQLKQQPRSFPFLSVQTCPFRLRRRRAFDQSNAVNHGAFEET